MKTFVLMLCAVCCATARSAVLTDTNTFVNPKVVDDWGTFSWANGEDGPVYIQGLRIESLRDDSIYTEIGRYDADPVTGFPDDADGFVSALNADTLETDFLFTFPSVVQRAGLYIRGNAGFQVSALNSNRDVLESDSLKLGFGNNLVAFRGFTDLPDLRSVRVTETSGFYESVQFDEVQWQTVPEPSAIMLLFAVSLPMFKWRKRSLS